ncbi:MAG TPA: isoprenylcysteine carboxylmethyltransferase family protein [Vicinamibacteria bacterium]|nr:isoprenylcysteine carboxylmethyltransferase family protein [Vicinamibacteria bacterium]
MRPSHAEPEGTIVEPPIMRSRRSDASIVTSGRFHRLTDVVIAAVWLGYAWATLGVFRETNAIVPLILLVRNSTLTLLFLARRPAKMQSTSALEWGVAVLSTVSGYFFDGGTLVASGFALPLMVASGVLMTLSIIALGRSFGIVPANRGIKTGGPYRFVRHPMYSCYVLFDLGYVMGAPSARNLLVLVAVVASLFVRAGYEERILRRDPDYEAYAERTPSMFVPGLL